MSSYLVLCQTVRELAGIPGDGPITTLNQTGELKRLCHWVSQAWVEIQNHREDWEWMRKSFSFDTVAHQSTYDAATDILLTDWSHWRNNSFRSYLKSAGVGNEIWLQQYEYNSFRDYYLMGSRKITYARPITISITPSKDLVLGLAPDQVYTVSGEYYKVPQVLSADADIPEMPARFHMAIVHKAMVKYGKYEAAPEVVEEHMTLYNAVLNKLEADQAPQILVGCSLI
jgi:hypothetical protein